MSTATKVRSFFNETQKYLHRSFGVRVRADIVRHLVATPIGKRILDIGCGNGVISAQFLPNNYVTFLDLSENMIELAKQSVSNLYSKNATYQVGALDSVEFNQEFDIIIAVGLLAHVESPLTTLDRISRLLGQDGFAIIQFSNYDHWLSRYNFRNSNSYGYEMNRITYKQMIENIETVGFQKERELRFSFMLPGMGKLPDSLLYRYATLVWRNKLVSSLGTDYIWLLQKRKS